MSTLEAVAIARLALEQGEAMGVSPAKRLLAAADARGYRDPDLAVKEACIALYGEVRSLQSARMGAGAGSVCAGS